MRARGALAWLNEVNSLGGIAGRRLKLLAQDDGGDARRAVRNVRALIDEHEVFCLFNLCGTAAIGQVLPLVFAHREADLWMLGDISGAQAQRMPAVAGQVLPLRASHRAEMAALVAALRDEGASRFGLFYPITPHGRSGADAAQRAVGAAGATVAGEATWRPGPGVESHVRRAAKHLQECGADALIIAGDGDVGLRLLTACGERDWRVPAGLGAALDCDGWFDGMAAIDEEPAVFTSRAMPFLDGASGPAQTELRRLLERWRPQPPKELTASAGPAQGDGADHTRLSAATLEGFLHARLLTIGLELAGPWPNRRSVRDAIASLRSFDLGIGAAFGTDQGTERGLQSAFVGRWSGGRWRPLSEPPATGGEEAETGFEETSVGTPEDSAEDSIDETAADADA